MSDAGPVRDRHTSAPTATTGRPAGWRIAFTAVLTLGMAIGSFPLFAVGALGPLLVEDLTLSRAGLGTLSTAFFLVAALTSSLVGRAGERLGGRRLLSLLFVIATISLVAMSVAPSYPWLVIAVGVAGLSDASANPSTNGLIADHIPSGPRGSIVGIKQSGVQIGSFLAGAVLPSLALQIDWRRSLLLFTLVSVIGLVGVVTIIPRRAAPPTRATGNDGGSSLVVRWLVPYAFFMGASVSATIAYTALYANEALNMPEATAGALLAVIGGIGVIARILWGRTAERYASIALPLTVLTAASLVAVAMVWAAGYAGAWLIWPAAVGVGATAAAWNSVGMLAIVRETARRGTSRASGHVQTGFYAGLLAMPPAFGGLADATGTYGPSWGLTLACTAAALATTLAWLRKSRYGTLVAPGATEHAEEPGRASAGGPDH